MPVSEQVQRRTDLLSGVPRALVPLRLVDDELRVVAAEGGLQHHVDGGADVVLRVGAVDVGAGDVTHRDVAGDPYGAPLGVGVLGGVVLDLDGRIRDVGREHRAPPGGGRVDVDQSQAGAGGGQQRRVL